LSINVRKTFGTGPFGDTRNCDESPEAKEKRLKKEAERAAKKEERSENGRFELRKLIRLA
jgi:hypothetical protein